MQRQQANLDKGQLNSKVEVDTPEETNADNQLQYITALVGSYLFKSNDIRDNNNCEILWSLDILAPNSWKASKDIPGALANDERSSDSVSDEGSQNKEVSCFLPRVELKQENTQNPTDSHA